jgi:hypothetical protein
MHSGRYLSCETLELTLHKQAFCRTFREPRVMTTPGALAWPTLSDQYPLTHHAADHRNGRVLIRRDSARLHRNPRRVSRTNYQSPRKNALALGHTRPAGGVSNPGNVLPAALFMMRISL